jgi:hypothetical protein
MNTSDVYYAIKQNNPPTLLFNCNNLKCEECCHFITYNISPTSLFFTVDNFADASIKLSNLCTLSNGTNNERGIYNLTASTINIESNQGLSITFSIIDKSNNKPLYFVIWLKDCQIYGAASSYSNTINNLQPKPSIQTLISSNKFYNLSNFNDLSVRNSRKYKSKNFK